MKVKVKKEGKVKEFKLINSWEDVTLEKWLQLIDFETGTKTEEATETILAAKDFGEQTEKGSKAVINETADLWFHTMVMLSHLDLTPQQVLDELQERFTISGLAEKASRQN